LKTKEKLVKAGFDAAIYKLNPEILTFEQTVFQNILCVAIIMKSRANKKIHHYFSFP
jgi:hypothetical protein